MQKIYIKKKNCQSRAHNLLKPSFDQIKSTFLNKKKNKFTFKSLFNEF